MLLFLESFYGGSHGAFADGFAAASRFDVALRTLPAERWRQRARAAAFHFAQTVERPEQFDAAVVTDLIDLADLRALWRSRCPPILLYMHESQATYPLPKGKSRALDETLRDIKNALHAERVVFNSHFHRARFLESVETAAADIEHFATDRTVQAIADKSAVLSVAKCSISAAAVSTL